MEISFQDNWLFGTRAANERTYMKLYGYSDNQSLQIHLLPNIIVSVGISGFGMYIVFLLCQFYTGCLQVVQ